MHISQHGLRSRIVRLETLGSLKSALRILTSRTGAALFDRPSAPPRAALFDRRLHRAIANEEGISALIFAWAKGYNMLEGKTSVSSDLLRMIRNMTDNLEVRVCTEGEWESAIVQGFAAFREIRNRGSGTLALNLDERSIRIKETGFQKK